MKGKEQKERGKERRGTTGREGDKGKQTKLTK